MAKSTKTPLELRYGQVPRSIDVVRELEKAGISKRTFARDRENQNPSSIPHDRLKIYAQLFSCEVDDLVVSYTKVKPLIRTSLASKAGIIK